MTLRTTAAAACLLAAAGGGLAACGGSSSGNAAAAPAPTGPLQHPSELVGEVGPHDAFTIALKDQSGAPITHLAAGRYTLVVHDESRIHDFHLTGGAVDDTTSVARTGDQTFHVTFRPGTYTFVCDPHSSTMHGSFTVS